MTQRDEFLTRDEFYGACVFPSDARMMIVPPPPAIVKPVELWTGKQLFTVLLKSALSKKLVNLELKERNFVGAAQRHDTSELDCMCPRDGYVVVRNSELLLGNLGKSTLGTSKKGLVFTLIRDVSEDIASHFLGLMSKCVTRWLTNHGFSIGIDDVTPSAELTAFKAALLEERFAVVAEKIRLFKSGKLQLKAGCDPEEASSTL